MRRGPIIVTGLVTGALAVVGVATALGGSSADDPSLSGGTTSVVIEKADEFVPDHSRFKFGNEALIVDGGLEPLQLEANIEDEVLITNTTAAAVTVTFVNGAVGEAQDTEEVVIEPGESFRFRETYAHSIAYIVDGDESRLGKIRVDYQRFGEEG